MLFVKSLRFGIILAIILFIILLIKEDVSWNRLGLIIPAFGLGFMSCFVLVGVILSEAEKD